MFGRDVVSYDSDDGAFFSGKWLYECGVFASKKFEIFTEMKIQVLVCWVLHSIVMC